MATWIGGLLTFGMWMIIIPVLVVISIVAVPRLLVPSLLFVFAVMLAKEANTVTAFLLYVFGGSAALYVLIKWDSLKIKDKKPTTSR